MTFRLSVQKVEAVNCVDELVFQRTLLGSFFKKNNNFYNEYVFVSPHSPWSFYLFGRTKGTGRLQAAH